MLQPGAAGHKRLAMRESVLVERGDEIREVSFDSGGRAAKLQHKSGVESVLAGRAIVHMTGCLGRLPRHTRRELLKQRNSDVARGRHGLRESVQIEKFGAAARSDRFGLCLRENSGP